MVLRYFPFHCSVCPLHKAHNYYTYLYTNIVWLIIIDIYLIEAKINVMPLNRFECFWAGWTKFNLWYMESTLKSTLSVFCIRVKETAIKQTFKWKMFIWNIKEKIILCHFNKYKITIESHLNRNWIGCSVKKSNKIFH